MKHEPDIQEPGIFEVEDDEAIAASIARARADGAAGRAYPHDIVSQWLKTFGDPDYRPFHEWLKQAKPEWPR